MTLKSVFKDLKKMSCIKDLIFCMTYLFVRTYQSVEIEKYR